MPLPTKNETKEEYMPRCISYIMKEKKCPQKQCIAICYSMWNHYNNNNVTERIEMFLEQGGTTTPDIDVTLTADRPKKKKSMFRRRLLSKAALI